MINHYVLDMQTAVQGVIESYVKPIDRLDAQIISYASQYTNAFALEILRETQRLMAHALQTQKNDAMIKVVAAFQRFLYLDMEIIYQKAEESAKQLIRVQKIADYVEGVAFVSVGMSITNPKSLQLKWQVHIHLVAFE